MNKLIITVEVYGKTLTLQSPNDLSTDDMIDHFNTILKFMTFGSTVQEIVEEEVICAFQKENILVDNTQQYED